MKRSCSPASKRWRPPAPRTCRCANWRARSASSHAAPRRHFSDKQALLDALALSGWERLGAALAGAVADAGAGFDARMLGLARAYVAFATSHPALIELMFATKHAERCLARTGGGRRARLRARLHHGCRRPSRGGTVVGGEPDRVAIVAFAALQGLVALANNGMLNDTPLPETLDEVIERLVLGLGPAEARTSGALSAPH